LKRFVALAALFFSFAVASPARAELIRITPQGLTPGQYEAMGLPLDPAIIAATGFRLTYWGGGSGYLINPIEVIIGTPGTAPPGAAPVLTAGPNSGFTSVALDLGDSTTRYGGSWNTTTGYAGTFSGSSSPSNVYDYIGFTPAGSPSQNYTNWNGATGLTSWNLYVYAISFTPDMQHGDWVEFTTNLPVGSYVIGYGQTSATKNNPSSGESTPFTFAGLVQTVPEPSSSLLTTAGFGFVLLCGVALRRRKLTGAIV
jgi:hypothetical protein